MELMPRETTKIIDKPSTAKWITKKSKTMEDKPSTVKWITKKSKPAWITKKSKPWITKKSEPKQRTEKSHGGGVGIQTHGNKLARALNTKTPDHSKFLNEYGYLKGGVPVKNG